MTPTIPVDKASTCFGGSIAEFAVRYGTLDMIMIIHETLPLISQHRNALASIMLRAVMSRSDNQEAVIQFLVDFYYPELLSEHRGSMIIMLKRSFIHGHVPVARSI
jgi:hypothetical protein